MSQRVAHAKNNLERLLDVRAKRGDIRMHGLDGQVLRARPELFEQRTTVINSCDGVAALRERQRMQAEACAKIKSSTAGRLG